MADGQETPLRTAWVNVRLTPDECTLLEETRVRLGYPSKAAFVRAAVLHLVPDLPAYKPKKKTPPPVRKGNDQETSAELIEVSKQLSKIGHNLNQMSKTLHRLRLSGNRADVVEHLPSAEQFTVMVQGMEATRSAIRASLANRRGST